MTRDRRGDYLVWGLTVAALAGLALMAVFGPPLIEAAYHQRAAPWANALISGQKRFSLDGYLTFFRRTLLALGIATTVVGGVLPVLLARGSGARTAVSGRRRVLLVLSACVALIVVSRMVTWNEAVERDIAAYMTVADGVLHGRPLYAEMWDHKPPAIHTAYAVAAAMFGPTPMALWFMGVTSALVTLAGCYRAGALLGGPRCGLIAAAMWSLVSGDLLLQANQPNAEVFMNAALVWAFVVVLGQDRPGSLDTTPPLGVRQSASAGLLFLLASLFKPVVLAIAVAVLGVRALATLVSGGELRGWPARLVATARGPAVGAAVVAAGWGLTWAYFAGRGSLAAFREAVFDYNRDYAGSLVQNLIASLSPTGSVVWTAFAYFPLLIVMVAQLVLWLVRRRELDAALLLAWLFGAWIAVAMPGRLFPHYYQLLLPPLSIGAAWLIDRALAAGLYRSALPIAAALAIVLTTRTYQSFVPLKDIPNFKYGGYGFDLIEQQKMAPWIDAHLKPGGAVYHWGPDPGIYFFSRQPSPVGFVYNMPLTDGTPRAARYSRHVLEELTARPPDLVVARRLELAKVDHPIEQWIVDNYREVPGPEGVLRFVFLVPRTRG